MKIRKQRKCVNLNSVPKYSQSYSNCLLVQLLIKLPKNTYITKPKHHGTGGLVHRDRGVGCQISSKLVLRNL